MAKRQTVQQQTVDMLHAVASVIPKKKRPKPGADGMIYLHCGYELKRDDLERLRSMRTKRERLDFLSNLLRLWFDTFAQDIVDHGLVQCRVHPQPADGDRIRVSLGMNLRV